jgi:hypothetical protein
LIDRIRNTTESIEFSGFYMFYDMELMPKLDFDTNPSLILWNDEKLVIFSFETKQFYPLY